MSALEVAAGVDDTSGVPDCVGNELCDGEDSVGADGCAGKAVEVGTVEVGTVESDVAADDCAGVGLLVSPQEPNNQASATMIKIGEYFFTT